MTRPASFSLRTAPFSLILFAALSLFAIPCIAATDAGEDTILVVDDFDASLPGALPPEWRIVWSGAGFEHQMVSDRHSVSGRNSFQLVGRPYWSAVGQRSIPADSGKIGYEFKILIEAAATRGEEHPGFFAYQAEGNLWGTYYATVRFDHSRRAILAEDGTVLGRWAPQTWYAVRVILDRKTRTYEVWIDGKRAGVDLPINAESPELVDSLALVSGHAGVPVYYDDVVAFAPATDSDADGVPDGADNCPDVNPGLIDLNVDGCVDTNFVIAAHLDAGLTGLAGDLPDAAWPCLEGAVINLEINALGLAIEDMLCATEILEVTGTGAAADAGYLLGLSAQTAALLAIDRATHMVGPSDPNVVAAMTLAGLGIDLLANSKISEAIKHFLDAISILIETAKPAIKIEARRGGPEWGTEIKTFARAYTEPIYIAMRVTNTGNVDLTDIEVSQRLPGVHGTIDRLGVGEWAVVNPDTAFNARHRFGDPFLVISTAVGHYGAQTVEASASCEVDIIHPDLRVNFTGPRSARIGTVVLFDVSVTNVGDVTVRGVQLAIPRYLMFFDEMGDLEPGESRHYSLHYLVRKTRRPELRITATARGGRDYDVDHLLDWRAFGRRVTANDTHTVRIVRD